MIKKTPIKKVFLLTLIFLGFLGDETSIEAQDSGDLHVVVNMVQLNVAVTDKNGNYITGLRPQDFAIDEDGIPEKMATFAEGDEPVRSVTEFSAQGPSAATSDGAAKLSSDGGSMPSFDSMVN